MIKFLLTVCGQGWLEKLTSILFDNRQMGHALREPVYPKAALNILSFPPALALQRNVSLATNWNFSILNCGGLENFCNYQWSIGIHDCWQAKFWCHLQIFCRNSFDVLHLSALKIKIKLNSLWYSEIIETLIKIKMGIN